MHAIVDMRALHTRRTINSKHLNSYLASHLDFFHFVLFFFFQLAKKCAMYKQILHLPFTIYKWTFWTAYESGRPKFSITHLPLSSGPMNFEIIEDKRQIRHYQLWWE